MCQLHTQVRSDQSGMLAAWQRGQELSARPPDPASAANSPPGSARDSDTGGSNSEDGEVADGQVNSDRADSVASAEDSDAADGSGEAAANAAGSDSAAEKKKRNRSLANLARDLDRSLEKSRSLIQRFPERVSIVHMVHIHGHQQRSRMTAGGLYHRAPAVKKKYLDLFTKTIDRGGSQGAHCLADSCRSATLVLQMAC